MTEVELGPMDLGRNQYVVSLELGIFQGRPKSIRPNSETVKIRPMAQEADSTHFFRPISFDPFLSTHFRSPTFKVSMLKIIAASSLYNSVEDLQIHLRKQLQKLVHAGPGFSLNPKSVNKSKDVLNILKSEELKTGKIFLWHDLITNTITPHKSNDYQPQSVTQLVTSLRSRRNLCGIVYCQILDVSVTGYMEWVGGNRSKERDPKSELLLRSTYQIFEWDRNNSDRNFYNVVRHVHIPLVP